MTPYSAVFDLYFITLVGGVCLLAGLASGMALNQR